MLKYGFKTAAVLPLLIAVVAAMSAGCSSGSRVPADYAGSGTGGTDPGTETGEPAVGTGTAIPGPGGLPHGSSAIPGHQRFRYGSEYDHSLPARNIEILGTAVDFTPAWDEQGARSNDGLAWCIYRFDLTDYAGAGSLQVQWNAGSPPADGQAWYAGFSDFQREAWHWKQGSLTGGIPVPDTIAFSRSNGEAFVVLVMTGDTVRRLDWLRIDGNVPPVAGLSVDPAVGAAPLAVNLDATGSIDLDGEINGFEWDLDGDGGFSGNPAEQAAHGAATVQHTYEITGEYHPAVRATDDSGAEHTAAVVIEVSATAQLSAHTWGGVDTDQINAVAHDAAGNTYLAGSSRSFGAGGEDVLLLKYDAEGNLAWARNWGGIGNDSALGLAFSEPDLLHVAGYTNIPDGGTVALLMEYGTDGTFRHSQVWGSC